MPSVLRGLLTFAAAATIAAAVSAQTANRVVTGAVADRLLGEWIDAAREHEPGRGDAPARVVADWPTGDLRLVFEAIANARLSSDLLIAGAMMHLDIAVLLPVRATGLLYDQSREVIASQDGRYRGTTSPATHLDFGRRILDQLQPAPRAHGRAREWYRATASYLLAAGNYADALPHFRRARELFPDDAPILFASGCLHEGLAAPVLQAAVKSLRMSGGQRADVASAGENRADAERFFRQAIALDGGHAEARVRFAWALILRNRHEEALAQLKAAGEPSDGFVRYYKALFTGRAEEAQGRLDAARRSFESAAALYPRAQSAALALSRIARLHGNRAGARAVQPLLAGQAGNVPHRADPWWAYYEGPGRTFLAELDRLRARISRPGRAPEGPRR